jgi:hypothetical protein
VRVSGTARAAAQFHRSDERFKVVLLRRHDGVGAAQLEEPHLLVALGNDRPQRPLPGLSGLLRAEQIYHVYVTRRQVEVADDLVQVLFL